MKEKRNSSEANLPIANRADRRNRYSLPNYQDPFCKNPNGFDYLKAQKLRRIIAQDFQNAFQVCDVIAGPVAPSVAPTIGSKTADPTQMYLEDIFTLSPNLAGLPAMSHPCGFGADHMPVGMQLIGNYFDETRMLQMAHAFQQVTEWHKKMPEGFSGVAQ